MKKFKGWLASSLFSAFIHTLLVVVVVFSVGTTRKIESKEKQPIEVELVNVSPVEPLKTETFLPEPLPPKTTMIESKKTEPDRPQPVKNEPVVSPPPLPAYAGEKIEVPSSSPAVSAPGAANVSGGISQSEGGSAAGTNQSSQRSGKPDRKAYPTYAPEPEYPVDARTGSVEGKVFIRVLIGTNGNVQEAQVSRSSGSASLDQAALRAIRNWEFAPTFRNGQPVADRIIVPVVFNMR